VPPIPTTTNAMTQEITNREIITTTISPETFLLEICRDESTVETEDTMIENEGENIHIMTIGEKGIDAILRGDRIDTTTIDTTIDAERRRDNSNRVNRRCHWPN
jgi:hypothetical protein